MLRIRKYLRCLRFDVVLAGLLDIIDAEEGLGGRGIIEDAVRWCWIKLLLGLTRVFGEFFV